MKVRDYIFKENQETDFEVFRWVPYPWNLLLFSPDEDSESKEVKPAEGEEKKEGAETTEENAEKPKKEWIINAWVKKQVAEKLPIIKPIPGFCEYSGHFGIWQ